MSYSTRGTYRRLGLLYRYLIVATKRLSQKQLMILLAVVVGLAAGFATYLFEGLLVLVRTGLTSWLAIDTASPLYLVYPIIGVILATLFVRYWVRDDISEGVTRVLYAMSKRAPASSRTTAIRQWWPARRLSVSAVRSAPRRRSC